MLRRLFLQLLSLGGVSLTLPSETPLLVTEEMPPIPGVPHRVIRGGSFNGRIFDGFMWARGINTGLDTEYRDELSFPEDDLNYTLKDINASRFFPPEVHVKINRALALYRAKVHEDLKLLLSKTEREMSLVTVVREPLRAYLDKNKEVVISCPRRHFLLEGELNPTDVWSDNGRIPLASDFPGHAALHAQLDEGTRKRIRLVTSQVRPSQGIVLPPLGRPVEDIIS
jgi:hypothetical protein